MTGRPIDLGEARMRRYAQEAVPRALAALEAQTGHRYRMTATGLLRLYAGAFPEFVCERIDVLGDAYDSDARTWGTLVQFLDRDRKEVRLIVPPRLLRSRRFLLARVLAARGFTVRPGRAAARALTIYVAAFRDLGDSVLGHAC